jgi:hypothetical protein
MFIFGFNLKISITNRVHQISYGNSRVLYSIFLIVTFFFVSNISFGQKVGFGPKLGANLSFFRGNFPESGMRLPKFGYTFGGYMSVKGKKNKRWQFEMDILYTRRGHNAKFLNTINLNVGDPFPLLKDELTYTIGYIEIPMLFKYMLNKGGVIRPYLLFGPVYSGLLHADIKDNVSGRDFDARDFVARDDLGFMIGWGIQNFIIDRWYHLDIRYYHGFVNISEFLRNDLRPYQSIGITDNQTISPYRHSTFTITLGVGLETSETFFLR